MACSHCRARGLARYYGVARASRVRRPGGVSCRRHCGHCVAAPDDIPDLVPSGPQVRHLRPITEAPISHRETRTLTAVAVVAIFSLDLPRAASDQDCIGAAK